jgi:hypothetical protein
MKEKVPDRVQASLVVELTPTQDPEFGETVEVLKGPLEPAPAQQSDITIEATDDRTLGFLHETVERHGKRSTGLDLKKATEGTPVIAGSSGPCPSGIE